jgi:hypothetical protein
MRSLQIRCGAVRLKYGNPATIEESIKANFLRPVALRHVVSERFALDNFIIGHPCRLV